MERLNSFNDEMLLLSNPKQRIQLQNGMVVRIITKPKIYHLHWVSEEQPKRCKENQCELCQSGDKAWFRVDVGCIDILNDEIGTLTFGSRLYKSLLKSKSVIHTHDFVLAVSKDKKKYRATPLRKRGLGKHELIMAAKYKKGVK